jgi:predicted DNA binding protein
MEIEHFLPYDFENSIGNSIVEIFHHKIDLVIEEITHHKSVLEMSVLEKDDSRVKFNIKTKDPFLLYAIINCGVLVNFPVRVREGYAYWRLVSSRERIDELLTLFDKKKIDYTLLRIGSSPYDMADDKNKLTLDESTILNKAITLGFFEIPRKISLEELAKELGKSKSALSVNLRKIIKKKVMFEM